MLEENTNIEEISIVDNQRLKVLGLKRTMAYVRDDKAHKISKSNGAERQARYRNKEKVLKQSIKIIGTPPQDVVDVVQAHGWAEISEAISLNSKYKRLPQLFKWLLKLY